MYKVLLVDDEVWVVESLKRCGVWGKFGFEVVGQAYNGVEAYGKIMEYKPDVVFVDIRMPEMGGLELMAKAAELQSRPLYVMASGYAEFAYAQKAMMLGAVGYCLKPFDNDEIGKVLTKIKGILDNKKDSLEAEVMELIPDSSQSALKKLEELLTEYEIYPKGMEMLSVVVSLGKLALKLPGKYMSMELRFGPSKRVYIVKHTGAFPEDVISERIPQEGVWGIGISRSIHCAEKIYPAVEEALTAAYQYFIDSGTLVHQYTESDTREECLCFRTFDEGLRSGDRVSVLKAFDQVTGRFKNGRYSIRHAYHLYNIATAYIYNKYPSGPDAFLDSYEELPGAYENVYKMIDSLRDMAAGQWNTMLEADKRIGNNTVKEIAEYLEENFYKQISIQALAQKFYMNPNYFCHLFRKETGETISEYLVKLRISYACELLIKSGAAVGEIAAKSGYDNYFYFCKLFKKTTGKTPTEYRNAKGCAG